jgi:RNA polymerase sigma factor (sigma-70 family)
VSGVLTHIEACIPALRRYAAALLRNREDADDLVHDCLVRALDKLDTRRDDAEVRPWLFAIMHNLFISQLRRTRSRPSSESLDETHEAAMSVRADQRDDLARWVSNRLNHKVTPPDLAADGYSYIGGRLAATPDGPAGMFMYDDKQGVRLTVFVLPMTGAENSPMQHVESDKVDGVAWIDKGIGYTVVGKLPQAELQRLADQVRQQLNAT